MGLVSWGRWGPGNRRRIAKRRNVGNPPHVMPVAPDLKRLWVGRSRLAHDTTHLRDTMSTTLQTGTQGRISIDVPAVPIHRLAAKERGRYGMDRVSLARLSDLKRNYWGLPDGLLKGWDGWTLQATNGRALVVLPVFPDITWADPADAELDLPLGRFSWDAKEYGRLVGKKTKARDGFHRLELEGDPLLERGRWMSETAGGFLDGVRGDAEGEWPRVEGVMPDLYDGTPGKGPYGFNAELLAQVQACVSGPGEQGVEVHLKERTSPVVLRGGRGVGLVMPITKL